MPNHNHANVNPPARTHAEAATLFRRPFAPGAIGFRAMTKVPYRGEPYAYPEPRETDCRVPYDEVFYGPPPRAPAPRRSLRVARRSS